MKRVRRRKVNANEVGFGPGFGKEIVLMGGIVRSIWVKTTRDYLVFLIGS